MSDHHDSPNARRRFPRRTLIKGAASAAVASTAGTARAGSTPTKENAPLLFQDATPVGDLPPTSPSVADLQAALSGGEVTVREIVEAALARIDAIDKQGPSINAVIELNPEALCIADALDDELAAGNPRGPMHGIPVLIKDNIATGDQMETTAGSLALVGLKAHTDSTVARLLREAGMVILGKTNLSEWANIRSFHAYQRLERPGRANAEPPPARSQSVRVQLGFGRCGGRGIRAGHDRHRNQRLHRLARRQLRRGRHQANGWPGKPGRGDSDFPLAGHDWADCSLRGGCRRPAQRAGRARSTRMRHRRATGRRLHRQLPRPWPPPKRRRR